MKPKALKSKVEKSAKRLRYRTPFHGLRKNATLIIVIFLTLYLILVTKILSCGIGAHLGFLIFFLSIKNFKVAESRETGGEVPLWMQGLLH